MKYLRIFLLYNQRIFEQRAKSFVFFLSTLVNPLLLLLLWTAAFRTNKIADWSLTDATTYYFLLVIMGSLLMSFIEDNVGKIDIMQGELTSYLLKPFSYYWFKYFEQMPYRLLHGIYAVIICNILILTFGSFFHSATSPIIILLSLIIMILGYHIAFNFKFIIGLLAFWITETVGLFNLVEITVYTLGGYIMPINFMPKWVSVFARFTPFPYIIYYPITAIQGKLSVSELIQIINIQIFWICLLTLICRYIWKKGMQVFTSFGQ